MLKVTVIVPCYNYGHFIGEALDSIVAQTYENWECIIVDDGSTDNSMVVIADYVGRDNRFKYIYQENKGLSAARNTGIKHATGELLQFLDADDLLETRKLESHVKFLVEHPAVGIVFGEARYFSAEDPGELFASINGKNQPVTKKISGTGSDILKFLLVDNIMVVSSPVVRKTVVESVGLFDETLKALEDWEYWLRCALSGIYFEFYDSIGTFTLIRFHPNSMSSCRTVMLTSNLLVRIRIQPHLKQNYLELTNRNGMINAENAIAMNAIANGQRLAGASILIKNAFRTLMFRLSK